MKTETLFRIAYYQLAKHGLLKKGWHFNIDYRIGGNHWAFCDHKEKRIRAAASCFKVTPKAFRLLMIHEVAHALHPQGYHGKGWRTLCVQLGGTGSPYYNPRKLKGNSNDN